MNFVHLPLEVFNQILSLLQFSDLAQLALLSKSLSEYLLQYALPTLRELYINEKDRLVRSKQHPSRTRKGQYSVFGKSLDFQKSFLRHFHRLRSICIINSLIQDIELYLIFQNFCQDLKRLEIENCPNLVYGGLISSLNCQLYPNLKPHFQALNYILKQVKNDSIQDMSTTEASPPTPNHMQNPQMERLAIPEFPRLAFFSVKQCQFAKDRFWQVFVAPELKSFRIPGIRFTDVSFLHKFVNTEELRISGSYWPKRLNLEKTFFSTFSKITQLQVDGMRELITDSFVRLVVSRFSLTLEYFSCMKCKDIAEETFCLLSNCKQLKYLNVSFTKFGDQSLTQISDSLNGLEHLLLQDCNITSKPLSMVNTHLHKLKVLDLRNCGQVTSLFYSTLLPFDSLIEFRTNYNIDKESFDSFIQQHPFLEILDLENCSLLDENSIEAIGKYSKNIRVLNLYGWEIQQWKSHKLVNAFIQMYSTLSILIVKSTPISLETVQYLENRFPLMKIVSSYSRDLLGFVNTKKTE